VPTRRRKNWRHDCVSLASSGMPSPMNLVIPLFPGEIASLAFMARSFDELDHGPNFDRISLILLTHRQDSGSYEGLAAILQKRIAPLFGTHLSSRCDIIGYKDLFPGTNGYSMSATAKTASLMAFAGNHFRLGDFAVLEPGEVIVSMPGARHRNDGRETPASRRASFSSAEDRRLEQACRLLGISCSKSLTGDCERFGTRMFRKSVLAQLDAAVDGGLGSIAPKLVSGDLSCDLWDLHDMWRCYRSVAFDHDRGVPEAAQSTQSLERVFDVPAGESRRKRTGCVEIVTLDALQASNHPLAVDAALNSIADDVAARVAALETFDPDLAARAIQLLNESCGGQVAFIQIGANDGTFLDPVASFINDDWRGVVVEPIPEYFDLLKRRYALFPKVEAVEGAIGRERGERPMYVVDRAKTDDPDREAPPEWLKGLASFSAEHLLGHGVARQNIREVSVPVFRGSDIVLDLVPGSVDLIVVDVEGAEREVLESFDLAELNPTCIIFECEHLSEEDELVLRSLFDRSGYSLCWSRPDAVAFLTSATAFRDAFLT